MTKRSILFTLLVAGCGNLDPSTGPPRRPAPPPDAAADAVDDPDDGFFAREVRPLFDRPGKGDPTGRGCRGCHYRTEPNHVGLSLSGLDLSTLGELRKGGGSSSTRIVVPEKPDESVLVLVLRGQYPYAARMPKGGNPFWSDDEVQRVVDWIAAGAKGGEDE